MSGSKIDMWVSNYVVFVLQQPPVLGISPAPITITFNSYEIFEVRQDDGVNIDLWTSEIGKSNSIVKVNGLNFAFNVNANHSPQTRQKVFQLFHYVSKGCDISFTFNRYNSYVPAFPHTNPIYTPTDFTSQSVTLPYCAVSLQSNAIDSTHDGLGILTGENSNIAFIVKESVNPLELTPCKRLSSTDFSYAPWILDFDGFGYYIYIAYVEASISGLIEAFLSHPDGTLELVGSGSPTPFQFLSINPAANVMQYTDILISTYVSNGETYKITIPNIKVLLRTGEVCEITFEDTTTISI